MHEWLLQSCPQTAFSFNHISARLNGDSSFVLESVEPEIEDADDKITSQIPKQKSLYVRKEFP